LRAPWSHYSRVAVRAGCQAGEIRTRLFRVTYATARLQTLDHGAPVAPWTVEKELGHAGREMLEEVYGRLGEVRHRSEVVEYGVEQHFDWDGRAWVPKAKERSAPKVRTIQPAV
jgi:integrase